MKSKKLPKIYRFIPAFTKVSAGKPEFNHLKLLKLYRGSLKVFVVFLFLLALVNVVWELDRNIKEKQKIDLEREGVAYELGFWEEFLEKHKDYRDAYFQASVLEYKLGNKNEAKMYVEKGLALDPNSKTGKDIEKFLGK